MKLIELTEDIHLYENYITDEDCNNVLNLLKKLETVDKDYWKGISFYESYTASYPRNNDNILKDFNLTPTWFLDLEKRFKESVSNLAQIPLEKVSKIGFHIQKWEPGSFANMHSDNSDVTGKLGAFTRSRYAAFLYLNDNFEGGVLRFKDSEKELEVIPKAGSFVVFHGGKKNMHEVTTVKKSNRYTIGSFWDDREESDYPEKLRILWEKELAKTRLAQEEENSEWREIRKSGLRLDPNGKKYLAKEVEENNE